MPSSSLSFFFRAFTLEFAEVSSRGWQDGRAKKNDEAKSENIPNDYRSQYWTTRFYLLIDHRIIVFFHTSYVSLALSLRGMHLRVAFRFLAWSRTAGAALYFLPLETEAFFLSSSFFFFLRFSYSSLSPTSCRSFFRTNVKSREGPPLPAAWNRILTVN